MKRLRIREAVFFLVLLCFAPFVRAESAGTEGRVISVEVKGNKTVAKQTVLANVQTKAGNAYREDTVSEDIRRLFALGYFTDVRTEVNETTDGVVLTFVVKEKPTVGKIMVEGNRVLGKSRILDLLGIKPGALADPRRLKEGIDAIKAEYSRKGYAEAEIASRVEDNAEDNTATIYLVVDEGARMRVSQVFVEGNDAFSDRQIIKLIKTKRRWWFAPAVYNEQTVAEDVERIRAFYRKHGYQDAAVTAKPVREPGGKKLYLHITVNEGLQHRIGNVHLTGVTLFPEQEIRGLISLKPGAVFNSESLQEDLRLLKQYYGDRGYIHAQVAPNPQLDPETKRVDLTYAITENELVFVNRVDVEGNLRTKDTVIRRELRLYPGEAFDGSKIRKSIERLDNLGFFEEVNVDTKPTADPRSEDLIVQVKEAKTGSFSFGGGFSSVDRLVGMVEVEQRNFDLLNWPNFTGAGQDLRFRVEAGSVRRYFDVSFTEPWIFGKPLSFGVDGFSRTRLRSRDLGLAFEEKRHGGGIRLGKEFADILHVGAGYQLFQTDITDIVEDASADLKAEQGRSVISEGSLSASFDKRNNRVDPTAGYYLFSSADLAGGPFAGDRDFYRMQSGASYYMPHAGRFVLEARTRAGIVHAYSDSDEVPIFERFFGGGAGTIRGYRERHVGPVDEFSNDPIGGEATLLGTLEEVMTIYSDERGRPILKGSLFYDVGDVWRRVSEFGESLKSGVGVGARITTPIGPVRLDVGYPLSDVDEKKIRFHFNVSRSF